MNYMLKAVLLSVAALLLVSCSKSNNKAPNIDPRTGKHPSGWAVSAGGNHTTVFLSVPSSCYECHGKDLAGGISKVSCFSASRSGISCHANGPGQHPSGWNDAAVHGSRAKSAATGVDGLAHCQVCHGSDYSGGNVKKSCLNTAGCHGAAVSAPHAAKPWLSRLGASSHNNTDASNAPACAACHTAGANSARSPSPPAPVGTAPGCFNNTLCHGVEGHVTGWNLPANHGAAAKAAAGGDKGFSACVVCHGANYAGGTALQSCLNAAGCHGAGVNSPHPATPWQAHSATDTSNSTQCAVCHTNGANSTRSPRPGDPVGVGGCFNNTLCHGVQGHAVGWAAATVHGAEAKKAPSGSTGFSSCQPCHGATFNNGTAPTCMNNAACHGSGVNSPHAAKPWFSRIAGQPTHTTTDAGNVGICAACHAGGANSTLGNANATAGTAGCFNNTLCHFHQIPFAPSATVPVTLHSSEAKKDLSVCQGCHGTRGTPAFDGATLADGTRTIACSSCHTSAKAHPTDWQGSGTYSHRTAGNINVACIICHDVTQGRTAPLVASPSCFSATFTNGAAQTRTCHASGPGVTPHIVPYNNHNATARSNINYCLGCHQVAATTAGRPGCQNCHLTSPVATPTGCTSCHANPPAGAAYPNFAGVHAAHSTLNAANVCAECHSGLGLGTVDHLNRARARTAAVQAGPVAFGTLARTGGLAPTYTDATRTCAATYCHGNTLDIPASAILSPSWGSPFLTGNAASDCTKCHGYPPATAIHAGKTPTDCIGCHLHVNASGTGFIESTKHINGSVEASGAHAFPNPGSAHKSAANGTGCRSAGCHPADAAGSAYPVTAGVAPNCRACHLNASPSSDPFCSDCHGSTTTEGTSNAGRPNSTVFPNRQGSGDGHNRSTHRVACTTCHPITTGNAGHGWSNRTRSTNAQVLPAMTWNPGTRATGQGSCNPSAGGISGCHTLKTGWY
jgi:predicted CxxxxCH...CXXCH cytochrome family protein